MMVMVRQDVRTQSFFREEDWEDNVSFSINASYENNMAGGAVQFGGKVDIPSNKC